MFGRRARIPIDLLCGPSQTGECVSVNDYVSQQSKILQAAYYQAQNRMGLQQDRQKEKYDRKRHGEPFKEGDRVMLFTPSIPHGRCKKLACHWSGPYLVLKKISEVTYRIRQCNGRKRVVVHFNWLKLCPPSVRSSTDGLQNNLYRQDGDVVGPPVNIEDSSSRQRCMPGSFIPDIMEYDEVDNLADGVEQNATDLATSCTEETSNAEGSLATEETMTTGSSSSSEEIPVESTTDETSDVDPTEEESTERRYPCREHKPPRRYADYIRI